ncbi:MAG: acyl-ACP--UDP-N-acetylglucosamine O-acyltransferase [Flavobacteriales bacterium]|nr:acyl-ACP--UDP-N-acetylglucosamine O-acyltransferase [Flavobacteriales bacterium]
MIHNLASVHPSARLGENVTVNAFTSISGDVVIGDGTIVHSNATIMDGARIGKNCEIFPGAVISAIPQDLKFKGEKTTTEIGDNTTIRECVTINRGTIDKRKTVVGSNSLLMAYTHLGHDVVVGNNCILANAASIAGHVIIEDFAILEGIVAVQQFVTIGKHSFIAGGSLVRKNVPPFVKAAREPLSYAGVNSIGLQRRGFKESVISAIQDTYRLIYIQNRNITRGIEMVEEQVAEIDEVKDIISFIRSSDKGIMKGLQDV